MLKKTIVLPDKDKRIEEKTHIYPRLSYKGSRLWDKRFAALIILYLTIAKLLAMIVIYILLGLIGALLIGAALMPGNYHVERSIVIGKPVPLVMDHISDLNHYSQWNPWQQADPSSKSTITGNPHHPGHKYAWVGKKVGMGSLTLVSKDPSHIAFLLEFLKPWKSKANDNWHFESWGNGDQTKVTWQNNGELPWPMARLMGPMITRNLNVQFQTGLENLKKLVEGLNN